MTFPTGALPWDVARLATFVFRAWLRQKAMQSQPGPPKSFFRRVDDHLFPMLGDPQPNIIQPFPLFADPMGGQPNFDAWHGSILTTDANASGALTFLWHLRALITGNASPDILPGSRWFPLIPGPDQPAGTPPPANFTVTGSYPPDPPAMGAFLGVRESPTVGGATELVVDLRNGLAGPAGVQTIILLRRVGNSFETPGMPAGNDWTTFATFVQGLSPLPAGSGQITFDAGSGRLKLVTEQVSGSGVPPLDGEYSMELVLCDSAPVAYRFNTPLVGMELPPNVAIDDPKVLFSNLVDWIVSLVTPQDADQFEAVSKALAKLAKDQITTGTVDPKTIFTALAGVISGNEGIEFGPLSIAVNGSNLVPGVELGPIQPEKMEEQSLPYSIGKIKLEASLDLANAQPFDGLTVTILDLRLGTGGGTAGSGLVAGLIPDMRDMPGFMLRAGFQGGDLILEGDGKVPLQRTIGPLDIVAILIEIRTNSLTVGIDLSFQLSVIKVSVYELGIRFNFDKDPEVFLHGLGLSFDGGGIKLAGMFAEVAKAGGPPDYVGGAIVSIVGMFQLSAIGGYTQVDGEASLFIFASLVAPLGGPPYFFITGIAGGFGYNRSLPPAGLLTEHPFIKVMRGEIPIGGADAGSLALISDQFAPLNGSYWIAAGIQFISFGLINGKLIVIVRFGNKFSFSLLGLAAFGISPIAYFELGIEITADEEHFLVKAGLSPNSYIIHPDIFSLRGDFGLGVWYASPHQGDFILSIGGYHPYFKKPEHYPELARLSVKCSIFGFVRLTVEAFFACTPRALMAGVSISLSAEFAGIGAGLDVYIDVFITWDPFYLIARMGVTVWFEFLGRHEIGVELQIRTPEFGGIATIDLALVSFDVEFGADENPPPPRLDQFVTRQLGAPAEQGAYVAETQRYKANLKAFNTSDDDAGLFKIDITAGRTTKKQSASSKQEGLDTPVPVNAEFAFTLRTKMPLREVDAPDPLTLPLHGEVELPLCNIMNLEADLNLTTGGFNANSPKVTRSRTADYYPVANFGDKLGAAQADDLGARAAVTKTASAEPVIALTDGIVFDCSAKPTVVPVDLVGLSEEDSLADDEYPLPFGAPQPLPVFRTSKSAVFFKNAIPFAKIMAKVNHIGSKQLALSEVLGRTWAPLHVFQYLGDVQRLQVGAVIKGLTFSVVPQQAKLGAAPAPPPVIGVPSSPRRRAELFGVSLRMAHPRSAIELQRGRLENLTRARAFSMRRLTDAKGSRAPFVAEASLAAGKSLTWRLDGGRPLKQQLVLSGSQTVRVIFQGAAEDLISDQYVTGNAGIEIPKRARRITLIGEGMHAPIVSSAATATATAPVRTTLIKEALGIEHDSTLLALGRRVFAGHGCVLVANSGLPFAARPMDSVPGFKVLRGATNFTVHWPAVPNGALVLTLEPIAGGEPAPALNEVRWLSAGAELRGLTTVIGASATALVMDVTAPKSWLLEVDLGTKWRLTGIVVMQKSARDMSNRLRARTVWDLVDDRLQLSSQQPPTSIALQVTQ